MENKILITKEKLIELKEELKYLIEVRRPEVINSIKEAVSQGDLSENADYSSAKEDQGKLETRIEEIQNILNNYSIITSTKTTNKSEMIVHIGSTVVLEKIGNVKGNNKEITYEIVGDLEIEPLKNKISNKCPLAVAIMKKPAGTIAEVKGIENPYKVKIIKITN